MTSAIPIEGQMSFDELLDPGLPSADPSAPPAPSRQPAPTQAPLAGAPPAATSSVDAPADHPVEEVPIEVETPVSSPPLSVEVTRSGRRRKTAQARLVGEVLEIRIPDRCSRAEEDEFVTHFRAKFERTRSADLIDLEKRGAELAQVHDLSSPTSIRWVDNQVHRWGSCTPADGTIRLSTRLARFPRWVIDYVIVHELAHLTVPDHSEAFWRLVNRYPMTERARGYLLAKSSDTD